jgi:hypothetical protein
MIALFGTFQWHIWQRCIFTYFDVNHPINHHNNQTKLADKNELNLIK